MEQLTLHPEWKQAVEDFLAAGFKQGDVVPHAWLESHFGMARLDDDKPLLPADYSERQFAWLRNIEAFRSELLEKHQIYLASVHGEGYRIVPPTEQTALVQEKFKRDAAKAFRQTAHVLKNVRLSELSESERKENLDAIARLSLLKSMYKSIEA